ncbi:hypothetical protein DFP72DRAFT_1046292 [Ephemerocybe angulata]|uniref:Uncharacterized protein n=1 Tax=Ephemerocybe angulata TaxID=980116 RepID=A0A8H6HYC9_9AGAR|nr:hypothetical protein DFP72DRAFT_1046292 [Tulosesus angulatus]
MIRVMISCCSVESRTGHVYEDDAPGIWDERSINPVRSLRCSNSLARARLEDSGAGTESALPSTGVYSSLPPVLMRTSSELQTQCRGQNPHIRWERAHDHRRRTGQWTNLKASKSQVIRERYHLPVPCISRVRPTTNARHVPVYIRAAGTLQVPATAPDSRPRPTRWRGQLMLEQMPMSAPRERIAPTPSAVRDSEINESRPRCKRDPGIWCIDVRGNAALTQAPATFPPMRKTGLGRNNEPEPSPSEEREFVSVARTRVARIQKILSESVHEFDGELSEGPRSSRDYSGGHEALDAHDFPSMKELRIQAKPSLRIGQILIYRRSHGSLTEIIQPKVLAQTVNCNSTRTEFMNAYL